MGGFGNVMSGFLKGFEAGYKMVPKQSQKDKDEADFAGDISSEEKALKERRATTALPTHDMGGEAPPTPVDPNNPRALPTFASKAFQGAVQDVESSRNYGAIGPVHPKYGRPLGAHQVMESNLPKWTKLAVGREVGPDEFLKSREIQDAVFNDQLNRNYARTGSLKDAASIWHSGKPLAQAQARKDSLGTRTPDYVNKVAKGYEKRTGMRMSALGQPLPVEEDEEEVLIPTAFAAEGGMIEEMGDPNAEGRALLGTERSPKDYVDLETVAEANKSAVDGIQKFFGFGQQAAPQATAVPTAAPAGPDPRDETKLRAFAANYGAASTEEVKQVQAKVDPNGELSEDERMMATMAAGYKHYMRKGDPVKAQRYAMSMAMHVKAAVQAGGYAVQAKAEDGDTEGAAKILAQTNNRMPNGTKMEVGDTNKQGTMIRMVDADGDLTKEGRVQADYLLKVGAGMQNGSVWLQQMLNTKTPAQKLREKEAAARQSRFEQRQELNEQRADEQTRRTALTEDAQEAAGGFHGRLFQARRALAEAQESGDEGIIPRRQAELEAIQDEALKWAGEGPGRNKFLPSLGLTVSDRRGRATGGAQTAAPGATSPQPASALPKGALKEQKEEALIDSKADAEAAALRAGRGLAPTQDGNMLGTLQQMQEGIGLARAEAAFMKNAEEAPGFKDRMNEETLAPLHAQIVTQLGKKDQKEVNVNAMESYSQIAQQAMLGNRGMSPTRAAQIALEGGKAGSKIMFMPDGRVKVGDMPPAYLGRDAVTLMAQVRGQNSPQGQRSNAPATVGSDGTVKKTAADRAGPAVPGATSSTHARINTEMDPEGNELTPREWISDMTAQRRAVGKRRQDEYSAIRRNRRALPYIAGGR